MTYGEEATYLQNDIRIICSWDLGYTCFDEWDNIHNVQIGKSKHHKVIRLGTGLAFFLIHFSGKSNIIRVLSGLTRHSFKLVS